MACRVVVFVTSGSLVAKCRATSRLVGEADGLNPSVLLVWYGMVLYGTIPNGGGSGGGMVPVWWYGTGTIPYGGMEVWYGGTIPGQIFSSPRRE